MFDFAASFTCVQPKQMKLISDTDLNNSPVVANCQMNRERNLSGSNGYDVELRFAPLDFLSAIAGKRGNARWLDLCCGTGKALIEATEIADANESPIEIVGVDLAGQFLKSASKRLNLIPASLTDWQPNEPFDLITCVHGLHYIGDKLGLLEKAPTWLTKNGRFAANLDLKSIRDQDQKSLGRVVATRLRSAEFQYSSRNKLIQFDNKSAEPLQANSLPFRYLGADDQVGPNYTGQPAVDSFYERADQPK